MPATARLRSVVLPLLLAMFASLMFVGATNAPANAATHHHRSERHAFRIAKHHIGAPYRYGADGPHAFDCSGLVFYSFRKAGFHHIPRTASAQSHFAHRIRKSHMHRGDLMFFTGRGGVYHVGIFAGWHHHHRMILHSPYPGRRVHIQRVWTHHWFAGRV